MQITVGLKEASATRTSKGGKTRSRTGKGENMKVS